MVVAPAYRSKHTGFQPRRFGHHAAVPWRIEYQLDIGLAHRRHPLDFGADIIDEDIAHATARCGQGQTDIDLAEAVDLAFQVATVDQAQLDDIDRNLRIEA